MKAHALDVPRTARYYTLGTAPVREVWLACHGYGQLAARFAAHFEPLAADGRLVVAPEGLSRFYTDDRHERVGASWMTREAREDEIADQIRYLDAALTEACEHAGVDPVAVPLVAFGFSQGAATAVRWLALSPLARAREAARGRRADRLVLWGSSLPHDLDLAAEAPWLTPLDLTLVAGDRDPLAPPGRVLAEEKRLRAAGLPFRTVTFAGEHRLHEATLRALAARPLTAPPTDG
ncbi:MAG TPA: hypothetical protein VK610_09275 [Rhodothermales bacterium]|nr:hypothetical protein [Rhodothermales bacterium]